MMHGPMNIKFIDAKQAKEIYQFKNIKRRCVPVSIDNGTQFRCVALSHITIHTESRLLNTVQW